MTVAKSKRDRFSRLSPAAVYDRHVSAEALRVLAAIAVHADRNGEGWPSARMLALRLGCKERVVQYHVKTLKSGGYLETFWRKISTGQSVRWFRLKYPVWEDPAETQPDCGSEPQPDCVSPDTTKRNLVDDETQLGDEGTATPLHPTLSPLEQPISEQPSVEHARGKILSGEDSFRGGQPRVIAEPQPAKKLPARKKVRGTRLPPDAVLSDEWRATAQERRPDLDPDQVFEKFKRYFVDNPDAARPVKKDWHRAWINWINGERHGQGSRAEGGLGAAAFAGAAAALGKPGRG